MEPTASGLYIFILLFLIVLAILWFFLPFAIFGTKPKLDELIVEAKKSNEELRKLNELLQSNLVSPKGDGVVSKPISETRSPEELMSEYGITRDGDGFRYQSYRYDRLEDAVAYARKQARA